MISEELGFRKNRKLPRKAVSGEQKIQETSEVQPDDLERDRTENHQEIQHETGRRWSREADEPEEEEEEIVQIEVEADHDAAYEFREDLFLPHPGSVSF